MMKKIFTIFLALTMAVSLFAGCGKKNNDDCNKNNCYCFHGILLTVL